jgi:hypothetical protein
MKKSLAAGLAVNYVAAPKTEGGKTSIKKNVKIIEARGENVALLDLDGDGHHHLAEARYSDDPTQENTFHFADEPAAEKSTSGANGAGAHK